MAGKLPYSIGDVVTARCEAFGADGLGRATIDGHELRLRFGIPGETATARIEHVGHHAIWATVIDSEAPSRARVQAPCPVVETCGGCPWQHLSATAQRGYRLAALHDVLDDATPDARWHGWHPVETAVAGYRTRALMMLRHVGGKLRAGFYRPRTQDLVPAEGCLVHHGHLQRLVPAVVARLDAAQLPTWRGPKRRGVLRAMALRVDASVPDAPALVTLVVTRVDDRLRAAARELVEKVQGVSGVFANLNDRDGGPVMGQETLFLAGARRQPYHFGPLALTLGPTAFVQTRQAAGIALLEVAVLLVEDRHDHAADLYSGVGVFGLALAQRGGAERVTLVESAPAAIADARASAEMAGLETVVAIQADAAEGAEVLVAQGPSGPDLVLVDPPRAGLSPRVIAALEQLPRLRTVLYVSCNPRSLARDLGLLAASGFAATDVVPVDMFPNTPHAEVVVRLCARKAQTSVVGS